MVNQPARRGRDRHLYHAGSGAADLGTGGMSALAIERARRAPQRPMRASSAVLVPQSPEFGKELRLIRAAKGCRQQRLLGRRGERLSSGVEPCRHGNAP